MSDFRSPNHTISDTCQLCLKEKGTLGHILGSCEVALGRDGGSRYTWRHDKILMIITQHADRELGDRWCVFNDLKRCDRNVRQILSSLNTQQRPDFIAVNEEEKRLIIMELTVPMESQIDHWHSTKTNKYASLICQVEEKGYQVEFYAAEVGCRGFIPKSMVTFIRSLGTGKKRTKKLTSELSHAAIKCSLRIFQNRTSRFWEVGR